MVDVHCRQIQASFHGGHGLPSWHSSKESWCQCRRYKRCGFDPWVGKILWSRAWQPTPVFSPGKSRGQRTLAGYSPCSLKQSDTTAIPKLGRSPGGGDGNPLQYSRLENPTDRGAWLATVHGVAKSWTRLND